MIFAVLELTVAIIVSVELFLTFIFAVLLLEYHLVGQIEEKFYCIVAPKLKSYVTWFGHVKCKDDSDWVSRCMTWEVEALTE